MSHILRIDASARNSGSTTRQLTDQLVARLVEQGYGAAVTSRDLALTPPALLNDVVARYPASQGYVAYDWLWHDQQITLTTTGSGQNLAMTIPLPETVTNATVLCDGQPVPNAFIWIKNRHCWDRFNQSGN